MSIFEYIVMHYIEFSVWVICTLSNINLTPLFSNNYQRDVIIIWTNWNVPLLDWNLFLKTYVHDVLSKISNKFKNRTNPNDLNISTNFYEISL